MEFLSQISASNALHTISQALLIPVVIALLLLVAYAVYQLGSLVVEVYVERRHYHVVLPKTIDELDAAPVDKLPQVIEESGMLRTQKDTLLELCRHMQLPPDALTEVAKRLLSDERLRYEKAISLTSATAKIAPMIGLMGTLIPLGPGIMGLSNGDLATLSSSLMTAFDTTVAGLLVAVVCYLIAHVRRRWYNDYLANIEGCMNTILEKADLVREGADTARGESDRTRRGTDKARERAGQAREKSGQSSQSDDARRRRVPKHSARPAEGGR
jgi:biopolymer transport protein ExbB/TolQ